MNTPASTGSFVLLQAGGADALSDEDYEYETVEQEELRAGVQAGQVAVADGATQADADREQAVASRDAAAEVLQPAKLPTETAETAETLSPTASRSEAGSSGLIASSDMGTSSSRDVEADIKQLEAQAAKVAQDMQRAAVEYTHKLTAGFKSALGGLGASEQPSISKLAGGFASWFLDPPGQTRQGHGRLPVTPEDGLPEALGLTTDETLVEAFKCKLLQTYGCNHNSYTPAIQMGFQGTLFITDKHCCFMVEERSHRLPFKVKHQDIVKARRQTYSASKGKQGPGGDTDLLRLDLSQQGTDEMLFLAFKDFEAHTSLDSALALVEHLMGGH